MTQANNLGAVLNGSGASVRSGFNTNVQALATESEGSSAPLPAYAGMLWRNAAAGKLYRRTAANDAWDIIDNFGATVDPTTGDDAADGYIHGSKWTNTTGDKVFFCSDPTTGAAVWKEVGSGTGGTVLGAPTVLTSPYSDRVIYLAAKDDDIGPSLRSAMAAVASGSYTTIKLEGSGTASRDGTNNWLFQIPAGKKISIVGQGQGFYLKHAYTSDTVAWPMFYQNAGANGDVLLENLILEGIWGDQTSKQEVSGSRGTNLVGFKRLRLYGCHLYNGTEMGFTAQNCDVIRVDRCHVERNTRDCINLNGRDVSITDCVAAYSGDDCFAIYVPSGTTADETWVQQARIDGCRAVQTNGIKVAAPRVIVTNNRLKFCKSYGVRFFTDEGNEGEVNLTDVLIEGNEFQDLFSDDQVYESSVIRRAITLDAYNRTIVRAKIRNNTYASTHGALWTGTNYGTPSALPLGLYQADDSLGLYRKTGWTNAWQAPTTAAKEPIHQRIQALSIIGKNAIDATAYRIEGNTAKDARQTETWEIGYVAFNNSGGTNWAIPSAETEWAGVTPVSHTLAHASTDIEFDQVRIDVQVGATVFNGAVVKARFSPTGGAPWTQLCSVTLGAGTNQTYYGGYATIPSDAIGQPVYIDIAGSGGNGSTNTSMIQVVLRFVRNGDLPRSAARTSLIPVTSAEKTAASSTAYRMFSPKDINDMAVAGSTGAPANATYITQTANATLTNEQALSSLTTGVVKVTTGTGVLSTAVADTDYASATHAARHKSGGADPIKLDELAAPTDVATLNASTTAHGLLPKLSNVATQFLNGVGGWATPTSGASSIGWINVKDYGAVGNGTTDDTTAIQTALAAAAGGVLYIPPGQYKMTGALTLSNAAITVMGCGPGVSELRWASTATGWGMSFYPNHASKMVCVHGVRFVIDSNTTGTIGLTIDTSSQIVSNNTQDRYQKRAVVSQCVFAGADATDSASPFSDGWRTAIYFVAAIDCAVVDCQITGPGTGSPAHGTSGFNGVLFVGSPATGSFNNGHPVVCTLERTVFQFCDSAINFYNAEGCVVSHCNVVGANTGVYGLSETNIHPLLDVHDTHLNCYSHGVLCSGMHQVSIHNNFIYTLAGGTGDGVNIGSGSYNISVCDNVFQAYGASQNGCVIASDYGVVARNVFVQNSTFMATALWLTSTSSFTRAFGNVWNGTFTNTVLNQGTSNVVEVAPSSTGCTHANGLIEKWGSTVVTLSTGAATITYPTAFPTAWLGAIALSGDAGASTGYNVSVTNASCTTSSLVIGVWSDTPTAGSGAFRVNWRAWGY